MQKKLHIKKGDTVKVITGDSRGEQGKVLSVDIKKGKVVVEGINMVSKHTKPNAQYPQGGIIKKEAAMQISNLMIVDPKTGEATRVGKKEDANGKLFRYSKKTGEEIK